MSAGLVPSTVWTQLALPLSPVGSIPFVAADGITIDIDPSNLNYYDDTRNPIPAGSSQRQFQLTVEGFIRTCFDDVSTGVPQTTYTINKPAGRLLYPAGAATVRVNNTYCPGGSIVLLQLETIDTNMKNAIPVVINNAFNINPDVAPAGNVRITFICISVF